MSICLKKADNIKLWLIFKTMGGIKMKKLMEILENETFSPREIIAIAVSVFLGGVIVGMFIAPKGERYYGCFNGSNCCDGDCCDDEE